MNRFHFPIPANKVAVVIILVILQGGTNLWATGRYRSDLLQQMAESCNLVETLSGMDDGNYYRIASYNKSPLTIRIADGEVTHIGYSLFSPAQSAHLGVIADFIERYWLALDLPLQRVKSVAEQMQQDDFEIEVGTVKSHQQILADSTLVLTTQLLMEKRYVVEWLEGEKTLCRISFPANHELLLGRNLQENDRRLPSEIQSATVVMADSVCNISEELLVQQEEVPFRVLQQEHYYIEELNANRYYIGEKDSLQLLYNASMPYESIANMLTGLEVEAADGFTLNLNLHMYNYEQKTIETTLRQFVAYCIHTGCKPYVGLISNNECECVVEVIMRNVGLGFNHVVQLKVNTTEMKEGRGKIVGQMYAFVPTSNLKNLFNDDKHE